MTEKYIIYFADPYGVGNEIYAVATHDRLRLISPLEVFSEVDVGITYDLPCLIDDLRRNNASLPKTLIDISDGLKISIGVSKADGGEKKWDYWKRIKRHFSTLDEWELAYALHEGRAIRPSGDELISILRSLANATASLWQETQNCLDKSGEMRRFFDIEVPVSQIFYARQWSGINIDQNEIALNLEQASSDKYVAYRKIADILKISPTGLNYWNVNRYLPDTDVPESAHNVEGYSLRDQLKISSDSSVFAKTFTEFMEASRDLSVMTRLAEVGGKSFPVFHPCGTISSRILVSDPHLQELRRTFRGIIAPDPGMKLFYFDYSQFEPGIMASLSHDEKLIELYNSGDIYTALSISLFENDSYRDLCKKIFLAFSYGMSINGISTLIVGKQGTEERRADIEGRVKVFFEKFETLQVFKSKLEEQLYNDGKISSPLGNYRRRVLVGNLHSKERRWAVSQAIQGTASLIFKTALIGLSNKFGNESILLPMHDAVLLQLSEAEIDQSQPVVEGIMIDAFSQFCPFVKVRVTCGKFSNSQ